MGDINWDLAPEGAERLVQCGWFIGWVKEGHVWCNYTCVWEQDHTLNDEETIATRPQSPRKTEEWTHAYEGVKCHILAEYKNLACVKTDKGDFPAVFKESLKPIPIKPQITKAKAWDRLNSGEFYNAQYGIDTLKHKYEIID